MGADTVTEMGEGLRQALAKAEKLNLSLQKEINMVRAISKVFFAAWRVDILLNRVTPIVSTETYMSIFNSDEITIDVAMRTIVERAGEEYRDEMREILDIAALRRRLRHKDAVEIEYYCPYRGWLRLNIMVVERDVFTDVVTLLFGWQNINEEKWREKEHKRQLEDTNESLKEALEKSRLASEAKSSFMSRMSHDMRTPMNAIIGMTNIAMDCIEDKDRVMDALKKIMYASRHLYMLINDVLDMSKIESGNIKLLREQTDLRELIENVVASIKPSAKQHGLTMTFKGYQGEHRYVYCSPLHMQRMAVNVISNAIKYNKENGSITMWVEERPIGEDGLRADFVLVVQDTGIGMTEDFVKNRLFKPFAREVSEESVAGTGLGMAIIREISRLMGGDVEVQSELGVGTTFWVHAPLEISEKPEVKELETPADFEAHLKDKRVLLVDDNEVNLEIAQYILENHGAKCMLADDGGMALELFKTSDPGTFDLILMDVRMPVLNGMDATRQLRKLDHPDAKTIPIIAMTAHAFTEDKRKCWEAGMNDHIAKPIDVRTMLETIAKYI